MSERSATAVKLHYVSRRNSPVRSALLAQLTDALQLLWVNRQKLQPPDFVFIHRQDNQCNDRASRPEFRPDNFTIHDTCTWIRIALFVMSTAKRATSTKSVLLNDHCLFTFFVSFFFFLTLNRFVSVSASNGAFLLLGTVKVRSEFGSFCGCGFSFRKCRGISQSLSPRYCKNVLGIFSILDCS